MRKFEVGKVYQGYGGITHKCTKRTDKTVWFDDRIRCEIKTNSQGNEYTTTVVRITDIKA